MTPEAPIAEIELPAAQPRYPAWTMWDILLIAFVFFLAFYAATFIGFFAAHRIPQFADSSRKALIFNPLFLVPVQFCAYLLTFLFTRMLITLRAQNDFWRAVKWNLPQGNVGSQLAVGGATLAVLVQVASGLLPIPKSLPVEQYFRDAPSAYMMAAFGVLVAPLAEELLFRGLLFPVFARSLGVKGGVVLTAFLFALIHQAQLSHAWAPLLLLFIVGLVLTITRAVTNSVAASWIIHVGYNATLFAFLYAGSQGFRHLENVK
jgi:CAAX protease family protein